MDKRVLDIMEKYGISPEGVEALKNESVYTQEIVVAFMAEEGIYMLSFVNVVDRDTIEVCCDCGEFVILIEGEDQGVAIARNILCGDIDSWKRAVESDDTTLGFEDWVEEYVNKDTWASIVGAINADYGLFEGDKVYYRTK